ncbi:MAG: hypothetical protein HYU36_04125 [Planctomycetes bacterium]|nr:hypothetical protein [Planctomycetota bacterium]
MSAFLTKTLLWIFGLDTGDAAVIERLDFALLYGSFGLLLAAAGLAVVLATLCYARTTEGITTRMRVFLALLRVLSISLVAFALLGGMVRFHLGDQRRQTVVFAVDGSGSMAIEDVRGASRLSAACEALTSSPALRALGAVYDLEFYRLGSPLVRWGGTSGLGGLAGQFSRSGVEAAAAAKGLLPPSESPGTGNSPLRDNLAEILSRFPKENLRAVVALTDGRDTTGASLGDLSTEVPVFAVPVGQVQGKDVRITRLEAPHYVYTGDPITLVTTIEHSGLGDRSVSLKLLVDGKVQPESEQKITLDKAGTAQAVRLYVQQKEPGLKRFQVHVPALEDEATGRNNEQSVYLDVRPEPIRVLYIEGKPRWEFRHVKDALSTDPAIRATFLIRLTGDEWLCQGYQGREDKAAAGPEGDGGQGTAPPEGEAKPAEGAGPASSKAAAPPTADLLLKNPARGFPQDRLELLQFDVVILGDVPRKDLEGVPLQNLYEFVRERGGGLATLGGFSVYSAGNYESSLLNQMLPVFIQDEEEDQFEERFRVVPSPAGLRHPTLQLDPDPALNAKVWRELPLLEGGNVVTRARPGAFVLARHDTDSNRIIFAAQKFFEGRVLSASVDSTYLWRLGRKEETEPNYHRRFWGLVVRWLARNPQMLGQNDTIFTDVNHYRIGRPILLMTRVVDKDFNPVDDADVRFSAKSPGGRVTRYAPEVSLLTPGLYQCRVVPNEAGPHQFTVNRPRPDGSEGIAQMTVHVEEDPNEFRHPAVHEAALQALAENTGGQIVPLRDVDRLGTLLARPTSREARVIGIEVRRSWTFLLAVVALWTMEWVFRKRRGLS